MSEIPLDGSCSKSSNQEAMMLCYLRRLFLSDIICILHT